MQVVTRGLQPTIFQLCIDFMQYDIFDIKSFNPFFNLSGACPADLASKNKKSGQVVKGTRSASTCQEVVLHVLRS